jgi:hypothetical protein
VTLRARWVTLQLPPRSPPGPTPTVEALEALVAAADATGVEMREPAALRVLVGELRYWRTVVHATLFGTTVAEARRRPAAGEDSLGDANKPAG